MKTHSLVSAFLLSLAVAACTSIGPEDQPPGDDEPTGPVGEEPESPPGASAGDDDNTYDHPDAIPDIWELLDRMQEEGPPKYSSRVHSCPKLRYQTLGAVLVSRGVNLDTAGEIQAGFMYRSSDQALGAPNYDARSRENLELTTASASKLFDIFVQAAPEIIAAMPSRPECTVGGVGARMFNDFDQCTPDGITCLIGVPATAGHLDLCNEIVQRASTPEIGKHIAVAALLAAAHTCE